MIQIACRHCAKQGICFGRGKAERMSKRNACCFSCNGKTVGSNFLMTEKLTTACDLRLIANLAVFVLCCTLVLSSQARSSRLQVFIFFDSRE